MSGQLFLGARLAAVQLDNDLVEITLDQKGSDVNTLDEHFTEELSVALAHIEALPALRGILLTSAKNSFSAGADSQVLMQLLDRPAQELVDFSLNNGRRLTALENIAAPIVCAINGYALGGGLEVALCADYRILASTGQLGLPEVNFGILPAWGGTAKLPRIAGGESALEWIVGGKTHRAKKAVEDHVVDVVVEPSELRAEAMAWLGRAAAGELDWRRNRMNRQATFELPSDVIDRAIDSGRNLARFNAAPLVIANLLAQCAGVSRDAALIREASAFAHLAKAPVARALISVYLANSQSKRETRRQASQGVQIQHAAVIGAGIMGGGIAYSSAINRIPVLLKDISQDALDLGTREAKKLIDKQIEAGKTSKEAGIAVLDSITPRLAFTPGDHVDIVVEAVVESLKVKQAVFADAENRFGADTVLASNTSSLSIADIAAPLARPQNVVGMHFFNPVHLMGLVEVIRGPASSDRAVDTAVGYAASLGKTPLVVKDCAGFLINRILGAYMTAFHALVHDGADFRDIDRVLESWGWPMGPAYLMDVAGIDTLDKALAILALAYPQVMALPHATAIQILARHGRYGQKTAAGFYKYERDAKGKPRRSQDEGVFALLSSAQRQQPSVFTDQEIEDRLMMAMVLEAVRCLEEGVVEGAAQLDLGMRLGTGFPAHQVGPIYYCDSLGSQEVVRRCERYRSLGGLYQLEAHVTARMLRGQTFYRPEMNS